MLTQHFLSSAWPAMQADEYQTLKDSIEQVGVMNPITLYEGQVIDGWHRYIACNALGVHCPSKLLGDVDPVDFVKSQNEARRHVSASQRALAITAIYAWRPSGVTSPAPGAALDKTSKELADMAGVSERTIRQAKVVSARATPEVKEAVKTGKMSVKQASESIQPKKKPPPKPTPSAPVVEEQHETYTALDAAQDHVHELQAMLAIANIDPKAEDKDQAKNLITELRTEIKTLKATLKAVTTSRDLLQNENAELLKQINRQRHELDKASKGRAK